MSFTRPENVDIESGERTRLLPSKESHPKQGWLAWAASGALNIATAIITAAPSALNALAAPSGQGPDKLSPEWWDDMSDGKRAHSIFNASSSLAVNAIMNALFLPTAWGKFKISIMHMLDGPREFIDNLLSIVLGLGGAAAAAAICYNAFLWLPGGQLSALIPAGISFLVTLASRYIGVKNVFKRLHNIVSKDAGTQKKFADALEHIDEKYLNEIQVEFNNAVISKLFQYHNAAQFMTEDEYEQVTQNLSQILSSLANQHPDLIKDKATSEYVAHYAGILFDLGFSALAIAAPAYLTFTQKGYDGVNTLKELITDTNLDSLDIWTKRLIGLDPGLASAMLYGSSGMDFRSILVDLAKHLYQHPKDIAYALLLLVANGFATSGMQNVAAGIIANSDNIIAMPNDDQLGTAFVVLNALGGGVVNTNATVKKAFFSSSSDPAHLTLQDVAKHLGNVNDHLVSHATAKTLRKCSLFKNNKLAASKTDESSLVRRTQSMFLQ